MFLTTYLKLCVPKQTLFSFKPKTSFQKAGEVFVTTLMYSLIAILLRVRVFPPFLITLHEK